MTQASVRRLRFVAPGIVVGLLIVTSTLSPSIAVTAAAETTAPPNVVIIITDDQVVGTMDAMPVTQRLIVDQGVTYSTGIIPTSLCCPSRSSLLTGNYAHTTGVYTNDETNHGAWPAFHAGAESDTLATELQANGYTTALVGKYLNQYAALHGDFIPPGWDTFISLHGDRKDGDGPYYNYNLEGTIPDEHHGKSPKDYSTDVLADQAVGVINAAPTDKPLFLYFATNAPHAPTIPAPRDKGTWPLQSTATIPAFNEANVSDKPAWVQALSPVSVSEQRHALTRQYETLMAVDDAVGSIVDALGDRATNTLFVFLSDNGYMFGSHRIDKKDVPYDMATRVPMFIRWDGHLTAGTVDPTVTPNVDLSATVAEATGIDMPMEGQSVLSSNRTGTVLEQVDYNGHPAYCGYRTRNWLFVHYQTGEEELYDYRTDPQELRNLAGHKRSQAKVLDLRARSVATCVPTPPGFSWTAGK